MDLSICILTHCQPHLLPKCVASCFAEIQRVEISGEVIVIDNASTDGSPSALREAFPAVRLIRNERNLGFSAANNRAIRISLGRYVLILNDDAVLTEGSLQTMLQTLESDARIAAVGPQLLNPDGSLQTCFTNKRFPTIHGVLVDLLPAREARYRNRFLRDHLTDWKDANESCETDHVAGACLLARRTALYAVGLFDDGYQYFFEDMDLCYRLKQAGWKIAYLTEAKVVHCRSSSFGKAERRLAQITLFYSSLKRFLHKHSARPKYELLRTLLAIAFLLRIPFAALYGMRRRGFRLEEIAESARTSFSIVQTMISRDSAVAFR